MKRLFNILLVFVALSCAREPVTFEMLMNSDGISITDTMVIDTALFSGGYEITFSQPVDHNDLAGPAFTQRLYVSYAGADRPTVLVTEGYGAYRNYTTELARYFNCNQIIVEHRYFGESVPEDRDWQYLTTWQSASDHHDIIKRFSSVFKGKWITTGVSKGGQTTIFHSFYYPGDVDIRVPYVAPLNFGPEDPRIYTFLDTVGSDECRQRIYEAQKLILKERDTYYPLMLQKAEDMKLTFERVGGPENAFEMAVLEYDFAYWQYSSIDCADILLEGKPEEIAGQFFNITDLFYFSDQGVKAYEPFFYQALTEMGYYGYRFDKFGDLLKYVTDGEEPDFAFSAPRDADLEYNYDLAKNVDDYVSSADNFIFIYGGSDTWSATSVHTEGSSNSLKIMKPGGNHGTKIGNLPEKQRELVIETLENWLK